MRSFIELPEFKFSGNWFVTILPDDEHPIHYMVRNDEEYTVSVLLRRATGGECNRSDGQLRRGQWVWDMLCPDGNFVVDYRCGDTVTMKLIELLGN